MLVDQLNKCFADQAKLEKDLLQLKSEASGGDYSTFTKKLEDDQNYIKEQTIKNEALRSELENPKVLQNDTPVPNGEKEMKIYLEQIEHIKVMLNNCLTEQRDLHQINDKFYSTIKNLEDKLSILYKPNPAYAIEQLKKENDTTYIYICTKLEHKIELLNLSIQTNSSEIIQTIIQYLKNTLTGVIFDNILINSPDAVTYYLRSLVDLDPERKEWKRIALLTRRYDDLGFYLYNYALNQSDPVRKLAKLQECLRFINAYSCLPTYKEEIERCIIDLSLKAIPG